MFVIVRHGNTFEAGEPPRRIGARTDLPLTGAGVTQAEALGRHFAEQGDRFTRVLVSPLLRTRQTAEAILKHLDLKPVPEPCDWLREVDHGPDEDRSEAAVLGRIGQDALDAWDRHATAPEGWTVDAPTRLAAWRALFAAPQHGATLVVTSNGAARFALMADPALMEASARLPSLKLPTGGYGVIRRDAAGLLNVQSWGLRP
ncbi:putative phosphoglycerate mutase [Novosphingobium chloroacetimidivorans]|uniref:Putative phosphoglycerate mutase n=1 Tax=Novosphingobium chloroacetimidivorans TaxID=1428314 RepID=A0A7W7KDQ2_9SPHN|nr:histidine phosphatase family protein [Novosphingobium chloroacetimidivorans]MBB4860565.1 putative phosphoglycerate mutase [Novosphingobium chloroacetimidivorans]